MESSFYPAALFPFVSNAATKRKRVFYVSCSPLMVYSCYLLSFSFQVLCSSIRSSRRTASRVFLFERGREREKGSDDETRERGRGNGQTNPSSVSPGERENKEGEWGFHFLFKSCCCFQWHKFRRNFFFTLFLPLFTPNALSSPV